MTNFYDAWQGIIDDTFPRHTFNEYYSNKNNLYGYRSDEFKGFEDNKKYLITLGDSWCYCAGIPKFENTWNYLLKQKLGCDAVYNLSSSGSSIDHCTRLLSLFFNKYKPSGQKIYVVCMFPSTMRREFFNEKGEHIHNISSKEFLGSRNPLFTAANLFIYRNFFKNIYNNIDRFIRNYTSIESLCALYKANLAWTDWRQIRQTLPDDRLNKFYNAFCAANENYIDINSYVTANNIPFTSVSETDSHPGVDMQPIVAQLLFDFFNNNIKIKYSPTTRTALDYEYSEKFENDHIKNTTTHLSQDIR